MSETSFNSLQYLLAFIVVFGAIIFGVLYLSLRKGKKKPIKETKGIAATQHDREYPSAVDGSGDAEVIPQTPSPQTTTGPKPVEVVDEFRSSRSMKEALAQTEQSLFGRIKNLFSSETADKHFEEIEEVLYTSDLGPQTVQTLMDAVTMELSKSERAQLPLIKGVLKTQFQRIFDEAQIQEPTQNEIFKHLNLSQKPTVWMVVGVNGVGKTTSIGKLAAHLAQSGKKVLVAAGDTFRAAAGNQLKAWTERAQVEIFSPAGVTDPSAVAFDAVTKAKAQGFDVVIVDTAGRLHTQAPLMEELKKMKRVMTKVIDSAPHEVLIVLDANSGQNALIQAREFNQALGLTGVILTKMDGTAKGGVAVGLASELKVPIRLIGIGEKIGDLRAFSPKEFVDSVLGE